LNVVQDHDIDNIYQDQDHCRLFLLFLFFSLKIHFYIKIKVRGTTSNDFELDKYYSEHDPEQQFNHRMGTLRNANVCCNLQAL